LKTITVEVHGGLVADVRDIPEGVRVRVLDYDNEGIDEAHPSAKKIEGTWHLWEFGRHEENWGP